MGSFVVAAIAGNLLFRTWPAIKASLKLNEPQREIARFILFGASVLVLALVLLNAVFELGILQINGKATQVILGGIFGILLGHGWQVFWSDSASAGDTGTQLAGQDVKINAKGPGSIQNGDKSPEDAHDVPRNGGETAEDKIGESGNEGRRT